MSRLSENEEYFLKDLFESSVEQARKNFRGQKPSEMDGDVQPSTLMLVRKIGVSHITENRKMLVGLLRDNEQAIVEMAQKSLGGDRNQPWLFDQDARDYFLKDIFESTVSELRRTPDVDPTVIRRRVSDVAKRHIGIAQSYLGTLLRNHEQAIVEMVLERLETGDLVRTRWASSVGNAAQAFEDVLMRQRVAAFHLDDDTDTDGLNVAILPRLRSELERIIRGAGQIVDLVAYAQAKGGGWTAELDTEYAALKLYYVYRRSDTHLTKKGTTWVVSVKCVHVRKMMRTPVQAFEHALLVDRVVTRFATEFDTPEALKKYLKDHPGADKSKHSVAKGEPKKDAPEGKSEGKDDDKSETFTPTRHHKELGGKLQQWHGPGSPALNTVGSYLTAEKPVPRKKLMEAADELEGMKKGLDPKNKQDKKDLKDLTSLISHLKNLHENG